LKFFVILVFLDSKGIPHSAICSGTLGYLALFLGLDWTVDTEKSLGLDRNFIGYLA